MTVSKNGLQEGIWSSGAEEKEFQQRGYAILNVFPQSVIEKFWEIYRKEFRRPTEGESMHGYVVGLDDSDSDRVGKISEKLISLAKPHLEKKLGEFQCVVASFLLKEVNENNFTGVHQDWSFVDEQKFYSVTLWCPLVDVSLENGALGVIPGSHRWYEGIRPSPVPPYSPPYSHLSAEMFSYLQLKEMQAGEALMFDHRLLHGSPPNRGQKDRVVVGMVLTHARAKLMHYYLIPKSPVPTVEALSIDSNFFHIYGNLKLKSLYEKGEGPLIEKRNSIQVQSFSSPNWEKKYCLSRLKSDKVFPHPELSYLWEKAFSTSESSKDSVSLKSRVNMIRPSFWKLYTPINIFRELKYRLFLRRRIRQRCKRVSFLYDGYFEDFKNTYGDVIQSFRTQDVEGLLSYLWKKLKIKSGDVVLDAGSGVGGPALYFAKRACFDLHTLSISARQHLVLSQEVEKRTDLLANIIPRLGDYHMAPDYYGDNFFDLVYFLESFGHSPEKEHLLSVLWRILRPGGILYIKDLFKRRVSHKKEQRIIDKEVQKINLAYAYDVSDLEQLLASARKTGFIIRHLSTIDIPVEDFENIQISPEFERLSGLNLPDPRVPYLFPLDFFELKLYKPSYSTNFNPSQYFLQKEYEEKV
ncbi:MAG: phytanoyl-CoA dioxygenase family protein [Cytophagales bacterium]|nr:phytanoyl-CoA dioxygenase family protein [Cytophagales bacterium]